MRNPVTDAHHALNNVNEVDMFRGVALVIPATGNTMIAGGDARPVGNVNFGITSVPRNDFRDETLLKAPEGEMAYPRWNPTPGGATRSPRAISSSERLPTRRSRRPDPAACLRDGQYLT